jgi:hypothetical protein
METLAEIPTEAMYLWQGSSSPIQLIFVLIMYIPGENPLAINEVFV